MAFNKLKIQWSINFCLHVILICSVCLNFISMEEQVVSRAHRMGATRPIHVEILAMRGTIEEQMMDFLQVYSSKGFSSLCFHVLLKDLA